MRATLDVGDLGAIELNPFFPNVFSRTEWPDGTAHREMRALVTAALLVEREPQGWVARSGTDGRRAVALADGVPASVEGLSLTLRRLELPALAARRRSGDVELIDAPWVLHAFAPRRLGVKDGALVELQRRVDGDVAVPARFSAPLLWLIEAGVAIADDAAGDVAACDVVVDSDGGARFAWDGVARVRMGPRVRLSSLRFPPGLVDGLFPERHREWHDLVEQAALWVSARARGG